METLRYSLISGKERQGANVTFRGWIAMLTGLNLAFTICVLVCQPPWPNGLSWPGRLRTAAVYIGLSCLAGAFGSWIVMPRGASREFGVLARGALRGWVFLPSIALLIQRQSILAQVVASGAAVLMAMYFFPFTNEGAPAFEDRGHVKSELFATEVQIGPSSWAPLCISVVWGAAVLAAVADRVMIATLLLATAFYLLALRVVSLLKEVAEASATHDRSDRIFILISTAFLCVLLGLSNPSLLQAPLFASIGRHPTPKATVTKEQHSSAGYQTIVLWPLEKEKKTVLRLPVKGRTLGPGAVEPLVIPFYGPYWYFKFAGETPGKDARSTKGDPLKVNVRSTDRLPLLMEAHQRLAEPIETARCAEMRVVLTNTAGSGAIAVGVTVADSVAKGKPSLNLGIQHAGLNASGQAEETFAFSFPKRSSLETFDAITVTFLPDAQHATSGRKVAVERFEVVPR